ncbi:hypothetical protein M0R45_010566 [Rubus argutus]|uniref:Uncharacterized protein n=1 Tax=Rubus argutus TaxID=59490 RepID=A0AAW1Y7R4_RUBAR
MRIPCSQPANQRGHLRTGLLCRHNHRSVADAEEFNDPVHCRICSARAQLSLPSRGLPAMPSSLPLYLPFADFCRR